MDLFVNGTSGVYNLYLEGNVKFLNVFSSSRLEEKLPDVPTAQESGYDVVVMAFNPIAVHKDTPKELQEILIGMIETACATDSYKEAATLRGYTPVFYDQQTTLDLLDGLVADMESVKGSLGWT